MKKLLSILLCVALCTMLFGCGHKDGDLGNQTTVDEQNGYTVIQEVTVDFNTMAAYFDKTRGYWKVIFSDVTETTDAEGKISRTSVDKEVIYIDEDGYTFCAYTV